jgi:hypothetical protein
MAGSDVATIVAQLKALNRTWCIDGKDGSTTADIDIDIDIDINAVVNVGNSTNKLQQLDPQNKQTTATLTPLEQARIAISKLPPTTSSSSSDTSETTITNGSIVPYLFSALKEKDNDTKDVIKDEKNVSSSSQTLPSGTNKNNVTRNEYELRQMEWHIVLLLELWSCASQSSDKERDSSKSMVLDALAVSILLYRDQSRQKSRNNTNHKKKRKKRKKDNRKKPKNNVSSVTTTTTTTTTTNMSEKEKETLFLDHLVQVLYRAPFLLPRDVPLSEFLTYRILSRESLFWERLHHVVSHIYETFEISNPFVFVPKSKDGEDDRGDISIDESVLVMSSGLHEKSDDSKEQHSCSLPGSGKIKNFADETTTTVAAKKRKAAYREKLLAIAKNKKRQRLASLTTKKKHRGSHFSRNLDYISKLLEKKKTKTILSSSNSTCGKMGIANSDDGAKATLKERKTSKNNFATTTTRNHGSENVDLSARTKVDRQEKKKHSDMNRGNAETKVKRGEEVIQSRGRSKRPSQPKEVSQQAINEQAPPSIDLMETILDNKRKRNNHNNNNTNDNSNGNGNNNSGSNGSRNVEVLPMTPRKTLRSYATLVVGETPVPTRRFEAVVVGATPVAGNGSSRVLETIVGETPTYENNSFGSPPRSLSSSSENYPFFLSPPVLPSTASVSAEEKQSTIPLLPQQQPVKLFGTVKLLKRSNSIGGSRGGKMMKKNNWGGNVQNRVANNNSAANALSAASRKSGSKRKGDGSSSIDKARAFLRSKSL